MSISFDQRDEFSRRPIAENIIKILASDLDISTLVVDGRWGTGKTEFCQKLIRLSEERDLFKAKYVDAYKYDHMDDPLTMLIGSIASIVNEQSKKEELISTALPVLKILGKQLGKAGAAWILRTNLQEVDGMVEAISSEESDELIDKGLNKMLEDFEKCEENIETLKRKLEEICGQQKLVIFIDELDRCRPSYSMEILEKIKHVFEVKNLRFVIVTNVFQLESMTKKLYGSEIDAKSYLSKFFSYLVKLPNRNGQRYGDSNNNSIEYLTMLISSDEAVRHTMDVKTSCFNILKQMIVNDDLSLRDIEEYTRAIGVMKVLDSENDLFKTQNANWICQSLSVVALYSYLFRSDIVKKIDMNESFKDIIKDVLTLNEYSYFYPNGDLDLQMKIYLCLFPGEIKQFPKDEQEAWKKFINSASNGGFLYNNDFHSNYFKRVISVLRMRN